MIKIRKSWLIFGWAPFLYVFTLIEGLVFLLRNPAIFHNDHVTVFYHHSFGHSFSGLDYLARLFYPNKISLIYLPHPRSNPRLAEFFINYDAYIFRSLLPLQKGRYDAARYHAWRLLLSLASAVSFRFLLIDYLSAYKTLSLAKRPLVNTPDWSGYVKLLREGVGERPRLPGPLLQEIRQAVDKVSPGFLSKPFVTLSLKEKGRGSQIDDAFRCSGDHRNYLAAVDYLVSCGYNIALTGETDRSVFPNGVDLAGAPVDPKLLNLFLLSECDLFIGQQSGPLLVPDSCGKKVLIVDALPHRLGTPRARDLILFKHLICQGKKLSLREIYALPIAYGNDFEKLGISVEPNSSDEILDAVKETLDPKSEPTLEKQFFDLVKSDMYLKYQGNRPPLEFIRANY